MKKNNFKRIALSVLTIAFLSACGGGSSTTDTTGERNLSTPQPTITPQSSLIIPQVVTTAPAKPVVTDVPQSTTKDKVIVELSGEVGATVWVNGEEVTTIGSDSKVNITLDTSGEEGSKTFTIILKNAQGQSSEPLVILVEKEEEAQVTTTTSGVSTVYNPPAVTVVKEGTLIDSTVVGVTYTCGVKIGKTDENGTFECSTFPVVFTVGNVEIGRIGAMTSDSRVFVQDLAGVPRDNFTDSEVLKIGKFLQSLDDDGSYDVSIKIDEGAIALAEPKKLSDMNATAFQQLLADGGVVPVSDDDVIAHLIANAHDDVNKTLATDRYALFVDKEDLNISDGVNIVSDLTFPATGAKGSGYAYASTDETLLSTTGVIHRQSFTDGNRSVTITVTITKGTVIDTKVFPLNVVALPITDLESVTLVEADLSIAGVLGAIDGDVVLATIGLHDTVISWASSSSAISTTGVVTRPSFSDGNQVVQLMATITKGSESVTKTFDLTVLKLAITDAEIVANIKNTLDLGDTSALTSNLILPTEIDGVTITWSSSNDAISSTGIINPDNYTGINKTATLTATLTKRAETETKTFDIGVPKLPMSDAEAVVLEKKDLNIGLVGDDLLDITGDITLPLSVHDNGVAISWESNNTSIISNIGVVHRPSYTMGSTGVKLTATLTKGSATDTQEFTVYVRPLAMTGNEMIIDGHKRLDFDDIKGTNSAENNIVANLILPSNLIVDNGLNVFIAWESNNSSIATNGTLTPPSFSMGDQSVRVTATIGISDGAGGFDGAFATMSKSFDLVVKALDMTDEEARVIMTSVMDKLSTLIPNRTSLIDNVVLPTSMDGTTIVWSTTDSSVIERDGRVHRNNYLDDDGIATISAVVSIGNKSRTIDLEIKVLKLDMTDADTVKLVKDSLSFYDIKGENSDKDNVISNLILISQKNNVRITWKSNKSAIVIENTIGKVFRDENYNVKVELEATLQKGGASDKVSIKIMVKAMESNDECDAMSQLFGKCD